MRDDAGEAGSGSEDRAGARPSARALHSAPPSRCHGGSWNFIDGAYGKAAQAEIEQVIGRHGENCT